MPLSYRPDDKPVIEFDPTLEVSPFVLFRRLRDRQSVLLVDVRSSSAGSTLEGAIRLPDGDWTPPGDQDVVLFDDDGSEAVRLTTDFRQRGFARVRALFGGLELYGFALDPEVVGDRTYLVSDQPANPP